MTLGRRDLHPLGGMPGQYGRIVPPDRAALEKKTRRDVDRLSDSLGMGTGGILDGDIDGTLNHWIQEINGEHHRRSGRLEEDVRRATGRADSAHRVAQARSEEHRALKDARDQALERHNDTTMSGRRRYPHHGQLGGPTPGDYVHYVVILLALAADFVAFYQILALVLGALPEMLYIVVLVVSLFALWLMHQPGKALREFRARSDEGGRLWIIITCLVIWAFLGAGAYMMRRAFKDDTGTSDPFANFGGLVTGTDDGAVETKALLFLTIYVTIGVVTLIAAYLNWNPLRKAYRKAERDRRRASRRLERATRRTDDANGRLASATERRDTDLALRDSALADRRMLACWLKEISRQQIALVLRSPEVARFFQEQRIQGCAPDPTDVVPQNVTGERAGQRG